MSSDVSDLVDALVVGKRQLADQVIEFSFRHTDGSPFPEFSPGAHIDVLTPCGERRSYSLTTGPGGFQGTYVVAVAQAPGGRGGSKSMHEATTVGTTLPISAPVDTFPLRPAGDYLLIAGGIGITAVRSMYYEIRRTNTPVRLLYLMRTRSGAAYLAELLRESRLGAEVMVHATDEHAAARFDLWSVLAQPTSARIYCCASSPVLESVRLLTAHWRASRVHFEDFGGVSALGEFAKPFTAIWAPTGVAVEVPAHQSLLDALTDNGFAIPSSCRTGTCGTCRVRLIDGQVDHRDVILDDHQRLDQLTSCVSRATGTITIGPYDDGAV